MIVVIVYKDGSTKLVKATDARTYENDPDYLVTVGGSSSRVAELEGALREITEALQGWDEDYVVANIIGRVLGE